MSDVNPPTGLPPVFRGGSSLRFRSHEIKIDVTSGLLKTTHGVSVDADPEHVARFGGAYLVRSIPDGLRIIPRGSRPTHYEIVPTAPMTPERYQRLLDQVVLELLQPES